MMIEDKIRLQKFISQVGLASRRAGEVMIEEGRVKVNGKVAKLGDKVNQRDQVVIDGKVVTQNILEKKVYLLNKPLGVVSSTRKIGEERVVTELVKTDERLYPVGRLDKQTSGLILLTNDGDLAYHLTHPKFEIKKVYLVKLNKVLNDDQIKKMLAGIDYRGNHYQADEVVKGRFLTYKIILHEGKNREIRKMFQHLKREVVSLARISLANLELGTLEPGEYRLLSQEERDSLLN